MKIIIANADFSMNSVKYNFTELEPERTTVGYISNYGTVNTTDTYYRTMYYKLPEGTTALRISGYCDNTAIVGIFDSNDNLIDIISENYPSGGAHVIYTLQNEVRQLVSSGSYIGVVRNVSTSASNIPTKVECTTDTLEDEELNVGYYWTNDNLLNMQGVKTINGYYGIRTINVEGLSKIKLSRTFVNCCALAFYSDLALSNLVAIGQNNGGVTATYTLDGVVTNVPSGAKYAAVSFNKSSLSTISIKNIID